MENQAENLRPGLMKNWIYCCWVALQQSVDRQGGSSFSFRMLFGSLQLALHEATHTQMPLGLLTHMPDGTRYAITVNNYREI
ncbi:hypothetical protein G113_06064 [Aeromonas molluscorum 848]|uniref:Uncharacterized protein n=1 Tax=Aeromonas molluscorum 848 TaxID=1268236 RepID=R1F894_9GAMM|nr:hypothetical protein G113_06064 [Aeromonas molluscorum 848]